MRIRLLLICLLAFSLVELKAQIQVHVNLDMQHTVGGESSFDRSKWITVHSANYEGDWSGELDKMEYLLGDLDAYLSRETGQATTEMRNRDAAAMAATGGQSIRNSYGNLTDRHQYESNQDLIIANQHRIYDELEATEAGDRYGAYINNYFGSGGTDGMPQPTFFELLNEPLFPLVDFPPSGTQPESITEIFDYHKEMAARVKLAAPNIKVGGYVTAFVIPEENDFGRWNDRWKYYIDEVGDNMDFYSFHTYDFPGINNGIEQYRKGANNEAVIDMLEHYTKLVDKEKPFVISEYGSQLHDWYDQPWSSFRDWLVLKAMNNMLLQFMERPDRIAKALPFTVLKARWGFGAVVPGQVYPWRMMIQDTEPESYSTNGANIKWVWSDYIKFYELWADVNGTRVDTKAEDINVQADAYIDGNKGYLIFNNLNLEPVDINPNIKGFGNATVSSLNVRHLYLGSDNTVKLTNESTTYDPDMTLTLETEATMILEFTFSEDIVIDETSSEAKYYATEYLKPITAETPVTFAINDVTINGQGEAILRVGLGRDHGTSLTPEIKINDIQIQSEMLFRGDNQDERNRFFGLLEIEFPYNALQEDNTVEITFPDNGGHVSSLALQAFNFSQEVVRTAVEGIELDRDEITIASGNTRQLFANVLPVTAGNRAVVWSSDNLNIATVDQNGTVTAVAEGSTTITVETLETDDLDHPFTASATVNVDDSFVQLVEELIVSPTSTEVSEGSSTTLSLSILPQEAVDKTVVWESSDDAIATVSQEGLVTGVTPGMVTITITTQDGSNISTMSEVTIRNPAFVEFDDEDKYLNGTFNSGGVLEVSGNYFAGSGATVNDGVKFWLREIVGEFSSVANDYTVVVESTAGTEQGTASATISLEGVPPTEDLPGDNFYFLFMSFINSEGQNVNIGIFPIVIGPDPDAPAVLNVNESLNQEDIVVFPNPTTGQLNIKGLGIGEYKAKIYDLAGSETLNTSISSRDNSPFTFDLDYLNTGMYILLLEGNGSQQRISFIVEPSN